MNYRKLLLPVILGVLATGNALAQGCDLEICVVSPTAEMCGGDESVAKILYTRLGQALGQGSAGDAGEYGQYYLTGELVDLYRQTEPGPPVKTAVQTMLTLKVADIFGNKVFDTETFELRGVGTSPQRAYINALGTLNATNGKLKSFVERANRRVIQYFDSNYRTLLQKASSAASRGQYEEALYYTGLIPACSKGYAEASASTKKYYDKMLERDGQKLFEAAKAAFAVSPDATGAMEAYALLGQIDPLSSVYSKAVALADQIKRDTKAEYDFENHRKYEDAHLRELKRIEGAKEVGVAYGRGQKNQTTNIMWK